MTYNERNPEYFFLYRYLEFNFSKSRFLGNRDILSNYPRHLDNSIMVEKLLYKCFNIGLPLLFLKLLIEE